MISRIHSAILRFEAPVICRDDGQVAEFVSLAAREYEDETAVMERYLAPDGR